MQKLNTRIDKLTHALTPLPVRDTRLPYIVTDLETGLDWQGFEHHNRRHEQLARIRGVSPKCYGFNPHDDGTEA